MAGEVPKRTLPTYLLCTCKKEWAQERTDERTPERTTRLLGPVSKKVAYTPSPPSPSPSPSPSPAAAIPVGPEATRGGSRRSQSRKRLPLDDWPFAPPPPLNLPSRCLRSFHSCSRCMCLPRLPLVAAHRRSNGARGLVDRRQGCRGQTRHPIG